MILHHVTILTGHAATHRLDTLDVGAVAACRALLPGGGTVPALPAFRVEISAPCYSIWRGSEPVVTCGIGSGGEDETWRGLIALQRRVAPVPPLSVPRGAWLAVVLLPGMSTLTQADIGWLGDFERCMAAAILLPSEP